MKGLRQFYIYYLFFAKASLSVALWPRLNCRKWTRDCVVIGDIWLQKSKDSDQEALLSNTLQDSARVMLIIERLINEIERSGLYTVGIYRKPGPAAKIRQLIKQINSSSGNEDIGISSCFYARYCAEVCVSIIVLDVCMWVDVMAGELWLYC